MVTAKKKNEIKVNTNFLTLLMFCITLYGLIFLRDILGFDFGLNIFTFLSIIAFFILNNNNSVAFLMFMIPFKSGLPIPEILLTLTIIMLFKNFKTIKLTYSILLASLIIIIELVNLLIDGNGSILDVIRFAPFLIITSLIISNTDKMYNVKRIIFSYAIGVILAISTVLVTTLNNETISHILINGLRLGQGDYTSTYYNISFNANEIGLFSLVSISLLLILGYKVRKISIANNILISLSIFLGFLSLSKAFMLSMLFLIILYAILSRRKIQVLKIAIGIIFILIMMIFVWGDLIQAFYSNFLARLDSGDFDNGRVSIFQQYNKIIFSSFRTMAIGNGIFNYRSDSVTDNGVSGMSSHNATQETVLGFGFTGLIIVILWFISMVVNVRSVLLNNKIELILFIPLITTLFFLQSIQLFSMHSYILLFIPALIILKLNDIDYYLKTDINQNNNDDVTE